MNKYGARQLLAIVIVTMSVAACDQMPGTNRYQLQRDSAGRMVRIDKQTGQIAILDGNKLIQVASDADADKRAEAQQNTAEAQTQALARPITLASTPIQPLGVKNADCETMWRDGKIFFNVSLAPPPKDSGRSYGIGLSGFRLVFIDVNGFKVVDEAMPVSDMVSVIDDKGKAYELSIKGSLPLSRGAYQSIADWQITWL